SGAHFRYTLVFGMKRLNEPPPPAKSRRRVSRQVMEQIPAAAGPSVAEIDELQRLLDLEAADQGHRRLQIVALLAGDAQFGALDRRLDLELAVLDLARQPLGQRRVDALAQGHALPQALSRRLLRRLELEHAGIDLAPG